MWALKKWRVTKVAHCIQEIMERSKKGVGERGGGAHRKKNCLVFLPESISFHYHETLQECNIIIPEGIITIVNELYSLFLKFSDQGRKLEKE